MGWFSSKTGANQWAQEDSNIRPLVSYLCISPYIYWLKENSRHRWREILKMSPLAWTWQYRAQDPFQWWLLYTTNSSGWNQQVRNGQVVLICCGNQGRPPLFILRGDTCTPPKAAAPVPCLPALRKRWSFRHVPTTFYSPSYDSLNYNIFRAWALWIDTKNSHF